MKKKMQLRELIGMQQSFSNLKSQRMKAKTAFKLARALNDINSHLDDYEKVRRETVNKYLEKGLKKGEKKPPMLTQEHQYFDDFVKEMDEVLDAEITIEYSQINLGLVANIDISTEDMIKISWLFKDK